MRVRREPDKGADDWVIIPYLTLYSESNTQTLYMSTQITTRTRYSSTATIGSVPTETTPSASVETAPTTAAISSAPAAITVFEPSHSPTSGPFAGKDRNDKEGVADAVKIGAAMAAVMVVVLITLLSVWFCCGGKGMWKKRKEERARTRGDAAVLPLHDISSHEEMMSTGAMGEIAGAGDNNETATRGSVVAQPPRRDSVRDSINAPPPRYEEVVAARGFVESHPEEEEGMVADGKMPLSEIVFEDVVLDHTVSGSSSSESSSSNSQNFARYHHTQQGNTEGHTNTV